QSAWQLPFDVLGGNAQTRIGCADGRRPLTSALVAAMNRSVGTPSGRETRRRAAGMRGLVVVALAGVALVSWASAPPPTSAQPAPQAAQRPQPAVTPIPVPEIAQRAEDVAGLLRQSAERLAKDPEVQDVEHRLRAASVAARMSVEGERSRVLHLQDRVVKEIARCDDVLAKVGQARNELVGPLFVRDSRPIWDSRPTMISSDPGRRLSQFLRDNIDLTRRYLAGQLARVPFQIEFCDIVLSDQRRA